MDNEMIYDFGYRLRQLREGMKLSRAELARKLGVSKETIYRYENNIQDPSLDRAKQLAVILHTSLDYLVGLDHTYMIRLPDMTEKQKSVLQEFLSEFVGGTK